MFHLFLPREENFFALFREIAEQIVRAAHEFERMLGDLGKSAVHSSAIKDIEHRGDEITHQTMDLLHKTFITPMDREDIHHLITRLDDILDFIDASAQRVSLYEIHSAPAEMVALAKICVQAAENVKLAVEALSNLKKPDGIAKCCVEINRLENEADVILRASVARLFKEEKDTRLLIKLKEIYELLETVTDRCEDVANIVEGMILEYA
jgi:predicted phosphate transport protein (TIGR00153 family)